MEETADLEATAETEAKADPETAAAEGHRPAIGVHHIQVDGILPGQNLGETADLEATAEMEEQRRTRRRRRRKATELEPGFTILKWTGGVHYTQVDGILLHRPVADQMDHRAPKALNHPPTTREMEAEAADAIDIV